MSPTFLPSSPSSSPLLGGWFVFVFAIKSAAPSSYSSSTTIQNHRIRHLSSPSFSFSFFFVFSSLYFSIDFLFCFRCARLLLCNTVLVQTALLPRQYFFVIIFRFFCLLQHLANWIFFCFFSFHSNLFVITTLSVFLVSRHHRRDSSSLSLNEIGILF